MMERILYFREVSFEEAKELVSNCLREYKKARVSEMAENLEIDVETVFAVLHQLKKEGRIE
jgi:Mn-dependent DtxR family transcriptional regulator